MPQERSLPVRLALPIALISLPLLFLLLLGVYFLRQDKLLVQTDAREKARQLGLNLMAQFDAARVRFLTPAFFTNTNIWDPNELFFQIGPGPRILFPPPIQSGSSSNEFVALTPAQSNLWTQAQTAEFIERDLSKAIALWRSLARTNLDAPARDIALFNEAVLLAKSGSTNDARPLFQLLEKLPPSERLPGGLPLSHLAVLKLLALDPATDPQSAAWRFIREPTPFSAFLLSKIRLNNSNKLQSAWNQYNRARQLGRDYLDSHPPNSVTNLIVLSGGTNWWLFQDGSNVLARSESATLALYSNLLAQTPIPDYLTVTLSADNRLLDGKPSDKLSRPLATISNSGPGSAARERLDVFLANPALLYARQRQRALWLGALLVISTIVAIIGLVYTTRSQLKQQRLNLLKSNFLSSVSHELRAPLASMRLMSESLQSGRVHDLEKQREYFHFLVQECRRLAVLVENVLDFSRIEQNRKFYEFESVDLREIIHSVLKIAAPAAQEFRVTLAFEPPPAEQQFIARADPLALQQALLNLLDNAIKHSPPQTTVSILLAKSSSEFQITIRDQGPGIPPSEHQRIFERFYRLGSELRRETQGVGIGLSIVKHIIESHSGKVLVQSEPPHGATFTLTLPIP